MKTNNCRFITFSHTFKRAAHILFMSCLLCSSLISRWSYAEQDAYLLELEKEAQSSGKIQSTANQNKESKQQSARKQINITKDVKAKFESFIKAKSPATYHLYIKLKPSEKRKVVKSYAQSKKLSIANKQILELYQNHYQ